MKQETTLSSIIALVKSRVRANPFYEEQGLKLLKFLELYLPYEQEMIEKAFEDGVGEGLTDPERPFTGKEYFDVKYKKQ